MASQPGPHTAATPGLPWHAAAAAPGLPCQHKAEAAPDLPRADQHLHADGGDDELPQPLHMSFVSLDHLDLFPIFIQFWWFIYVTRLLGVGLRSTRCLNKESLERLDISSNKISNWQLYFLRWGYREGGKCVWWLLWVNVPISHCWSVWNVFGFLLWWGMLVWL